jgi:hypothetical protein
MLRCSEACARRGRFRRRGKNCLAEISCSGRQKIILNLKLLVAISRLSATAILQRAIWRDAKQSAMTSLTAQLAKRAAESTNQLDLRAQKKAHSQSLLFAPAIAGAQDFDTLYEICVEGFQALCEMDRRFVGFSRSIFGPQSKNEERAQMTAAKNEELDETLEHLLMLLGPKLLLKPAVKVAEWLIRRFR